MNKFATLLAFLAITATAFAADTSLADSLYAAGQYARAADLYRTELKTNPSADLYYNLGNACFKQGDLAQSILAYERCLRLDPGYDDARFNLAFAQSRITDKIPADEGFFLANWLRDVRDRVSVSAWLWTSVVCFWLMLVGILAFLLCKNTVLRKLGFFGALLFLVFCVYTGINAGSLDARNAERAEAVITRGIVNAKSSPSAAGTDLFTLHEGTSVTITETVSDWVNIHVGQHDGWVPAACLERI